MATTGLKSGVWLNNGSYRIEGILGQGSFGITYLATAKIVTEGNLGRMEVEAKVAIKEFFMGEVNSRKEGKSQVDGSSGDIFANYRRKFRKEAENLAKLSHPNIVKVLDVFDENGTTYYVMEFIEGQNLDDYTRDKGSVPEDEAVEIIKEVSEALDYMHSKKMLHLDLKPKNIMLRNDGSVCLIDFGLSKQFIEGGVPESSTSIGLGTPGYSPLEQAAYKPTGSFPATLDVYALGATFFKLLTGSRPAEATYILNDGFPEYVVAKKGVSPHIIRALKNAMNPFLQNRTATVKGFISSLDEEEHTVFDNGSKESAADQDTEYRKDANSSQNYEPEQLEGEVSDVEYDSGGFPDYDTPNKSHKGTIETVLITLVTAVAVVFIVLMFRGSMSPDENPAEMELDLPGVEKKVVRTVSDMKWDSPLGMATYTGEVEPDSVEGSTKVIPHGNGVANIMEGPYAGNTYEGEFYWGNMEGRASYTQKNGDTFVGKFKANKYDRGRYKIKSSGEYYEGTFRDGQVDKGNWYDKYGNKM